MGRTEADAGLISGVVNMRPLHKKRHVIAQKECNIEAEVSLIWVLVMISRGTASHSTEEVQNLVLCKKTHASEKQGSAQ